MVGNFYYPPNVPAYKPIMKFLRNYPSYNVFTNCPSVVYQNFLMEFQRIVVSFDPLPSTDEPEKRPLKEFLTKFSVSNRQRPLTLDFQTFVHQLALIIVMVFGGNYSSTEQVNSIQQLLAFSLITGTEVDIEEIIYNDLVTKLVNKSRLKYVLYPRFISCALQVLLGPDCTQDKKFRTRLKKVRKTFWELVTKWITILSLTKSNISLLILKETNPLHPLLPTEASDTDISSDNILKKYDDTLLPIKRKLVKYLRKMSRVLFERITEDQWEKNEEGTVYYADFKASIDEYYNEKSMEIITQLFKDIKNSVKDDLATNKMIEEAYETLAKISTQTTKILSSVKCSDFATLQFTIKNIQDHAFKQKEASAAWMKSYTNIAWNLVIHPEPFVPQREGKGIAIDDQAVDQRNLVKASSIVCPGPDEPVRVEFVNNGKKFYLTEQEIQEYWDKEENIKKAKEEARLNAIRKTEVIKVVRKEAKKIGIHPKEAITSKAGELFKKLRMLNMSRLKPETITDIKIHPKNKPVVITVYKGTDGRNFNVHKPFLFGAFGISELDELKEIIPKKKNIVVKDLMNSLSRRYERLRQIPMELGIKSALPAPEQSLSTSRRKHKHMELEPETRIPGSECNRALPENVPWSDIDKVGTKALVSYLVAASMVKSPKNARFSMKLRKVIAEHPDQEKLKSKKVKLEALGYKMD
nr:hypothetical protein [Tanacetum cinerariifolium]